MSKTFALKVSAFHQGTSITRVSILPSRCQSLLGQSFIVLLSVCDV